MPYNPQTGEWETIDQQALRYDLEQQDANHPDIQWRNSWSDEEKQFAGMYGEGALRVRQKRQGMLGNYGPVDQYGGNNPFLPPDEIAPYAQFQHEKAVNRFNSRLGEESRDLVLRGLENMQVYRPGGAAALTSGLYQSAAQANLARRVEPIDMMAEWRWNKQKKAEKEQRKANMIGALTTMAGTAIGGAFGGPAGAAIGGSLGSAAGSAITGGRYQANTSGMGQGIGMLGGGQTQQAGGKQDFGQGPNSQMDQMQQANNQALGYAGGGGGGGVVPLNFNAGQPGQAPIGQEQRISSAGGGGGAGTSHGTTGQAASPQGGPSTSTTPGQGGQPGAAAGGVFNFDASLQSMGAHAPLPQTYAAMFNYYAPAERDFWDDRLQNINRLSFVGSY